MTRTPSDDGQRGAHAPRFFVLTGQEVYQVYGERNAEYRAHYRERHGRDYEARGVPNVTLEKVLAFEGRWDKITAALDETR
jgi:hypothetical protein